MLIEASCGVKLCMGEGRSLVYGGGEFTVLKFINVGAKKIRVSSSMASNGKVKTKTAKRRDCG